MHVNAFTFETTVAPNSERDSLMFSYREEFKKRDWQEKVEQNRRNSRRERESGEEREKLRNENRG